MVETLANLIERSSTTLKWSKLSLNSCRIVFKGCGEEEAVLCTSENTYLVREVETTNLVMLVEEPTTSQTNEYIHEVSEVIDNDPVDYMGRSTQQALMEKGSDQNLVSVTALVNSHLELSQIQPKLEKLDEILRFKNVIQDIVNAEHGGHELPAGETWSSLVELVQASENEISEALLELEAVRIDGRWMGISQETYSGFVKLVMLTAAEHGWGLDKIPSVEMALELEKHGVKGQLTLQLLHKLSTENQSKVSFEDLDREDWREMPNMLHPCCLNTDTLSRYIGIGLLLDKPHWEDKNGFIEAWKSLLPDHIHPNMGMLRGECLDTSSESLGEHGRKAITASIRKLRASELSRDPSERFNQLFTFHKEWTFTQVEPFICKLTGPGQTVEELLLKYARPCQTHPGDEVTYTARF